MLRIGLVVNPVAGMGGPVGLKGTDGEDILREAMRRGGRRQALDRAVAALKSVPRGGAGLSFLTCRGEMGEDALMASGITCEVVCEHGGVTSARDTKAAVNRFVSMAVDLLVFVGGDGTARDVLSETGDRVPIVGVPSGVKMHSAVFVNTPSDLGGLLAVFEQSRATTEAEVLDVDEDSFREGEVRARLFGVALVPDGTGYIQAGKHSYASGSADDEAEEIAQYIVDFMEPGVTYVIGPGSTTARIAKAMCQPKTLLGVDVYRDRVRVRADAAESDLMDELGAHGNARIVVTPIGAQGFFFGRGNQQISPRVIRAVGAKNVVVVSTASKLRDTPVLRVDTGDPGLDDEFRGSIKVATGYKRKKLVSVA